MWHSRKISAILSKHSGMARDIIKQVPQILENPIAILKSKQSGSRILMFGELSDVNGSPVMAVLELQPTNRGGEVLNLNVIASAYGKDSNAARFIESSDLLYLDPHRNRTERWLQGLGLQLPSDITSLGSIGTVTYQDGNVKIEGVPYQQYMRAGKENVPRYSLKDAKNEFQFDINEWNREGRPEGERFILGSTGPVLQGLGAIEADIYLNGDKINTILSDHPEMTLEKIKRLPEILDDPVLVLKSRNVGRENRANTRLITFGMRKAKNGLPVLCVLDLRPVEGGFVVNDMQKVSSAYTKSKDPVSFVQHSDVLYADKKRATSLLRTIGFQAPIELQQSGSIGSISYKGQNVNIQGVPFSEILSNDDDIRYSLKGAETDSNVAAIMKYAALLEKELAYWKVSKKSRNVNSKLLSATVTARTGEKSPEPRPSTVFSLCQYLLSKTINSRHKRICGGGWRARLGKCSRWLGGSLCRLVEIAGSE